MLCNVIDNGRLIRRLIIIRTIRGSIALQCECQIKLIIFGTSMKLLFESVSNYLDVSFSYLESDE